MNIIIAFELFPRLISLCSSSICSRLCLRPNGCPNGWLDAIVAPRPPRCHLSLPAHPSRSDLSHTKVMDRRRSPLRHRHLRLHRRRSLHLSENEGPELLDAERGDPGLARHFPSDISASAGDFGGQRAGEYRDAAAAGYAAERVSGICVGDDVVEAGCYARFCAESRVCSFRYIFLYYSDLSF